MTKTGWLFLILLTISGCNNVNIAPFPKDHLFTPDLVNQVCAEYELVDETNITFRLVQELPLLAAGPCDHMRGWSSAGFKNVQNWARDSIAEVNKN